MVFIDSPNQAFGRTASESLWELVKNIDFLGLTLDL